MRQQDRDRLLTVRTLPLALAALAVAAPATAQDGSEVAERRTVEGAQKFVGDFYTARRDQTVSTYAHLVGGQWEVQQGKVLPEDTWIHAKLVGMARSDKCSTSLQIGEPRKYTVGYFGTPPLEPNAPKMLTATIDWSQVSSIAIYEQREFKKGLGVTNVGWVVGPSGSNISFLHADQESAKRVAFAMEFLRENCGVKSDTGF